MGGLLRRFLLITLSGTALVLAVSFFASTGCDSSPPAHGPAAGEGEEKTVPAPEPPAVNLPPAPVPNTAPLSTTVAPPEDARTPDRELGVGRFHESAPPVPERRDLRAESETAFGVLMTALAEVGLPEKSLKIESVEPQEDAAAIWTVRRLSAEVPADKTIGDYVWPLTEAIMRDDISVRAQLGVHGAHCLIAALPECRAFAEIRAASPAAEAADKPQDVSEKAAVMKSEELPSEAAELESHELNVRAKQQRKTSQDGQPRLAIILDDGGYPGGATHAVLALDPALTLSILPDAPQSASVAKRAVKAGFEVMLHMPMAPVAAGLRYPGQLTPDMDAEQIRTLTLKALEQIPGAKGINNHTGSRFTVHGKSLALFMAVAAEKGLYFVDSRTTAKSVAYAAAKKAGVRAAERDVFLDHSNDSESIRKQLARAVKIAKQSGSAIAIGHFRSATAKVLAEELPKLKQEGILLVHASALVE